LASELKQFCHCCHGRFYQLMYFPSFLIAVI
jgi:hypothetical protein